MRVKIPMTGTVIDFDPENYKLDGIGISGDPSDPVRPISLDLGNVSWKLISIDLENDLMEVDIEAPDKIPEPVFDSKGKPVIIRDSNTPEGRQATIMRPATSTEKQQILVNAQNVLSKTTDELYSLVKEKRLVKSTDIMGKMKMSIPD